MFPFKTLEMPVTGLRLRFFFIIFTVLLVVAIVSIVTHDTFLRQDRMALIDQQVRNTAASLINTEKGNFRRIDFVQGERIVAEELGPSRTARIFIVRDDQNQIVYESEGAKQYRLAEINPDQQWTSIYRDGKFIRILSLKTPKLANRSLQVGYLMDEQLVNANYFSSTSLVYLAAILFLGFAASLLLTSWLLKPIEQIGRFLVFISDRSRSHPFIPSIPESLFPKSKFFSKSKDEFTNMLAGLNGLIHIVNQNYQCSRLWAYQMAHELKTPLAILNLEIEKIQRQTGIPLEETQPLTTESMKISETINSFLAWAELENAPQQRDLFANRMSTLTQSICKRLENSFPNRIKLEIHGEVNIIANPQHLEQLISNLLTNGLIYSDPSTSMIVRVSNNSLSFIDFGNGIPDEVLNRLGEPFNRSKPVRGPTKGSGLGLAWAHSICRIYSWKMSIKSTTSGTEIMIRFLPEQENTVTFNHPRLDH